MHDEYERPIEPAPAPPAPPVPGPPAPPVPPQTVAVAPPPEPPAPVRRRRGGCAVLAAGLIGGVIGAVVVAGAMRLLPASTGAGTATQTKTGSGTVTIVTDGKAGPIEAVAAKVTPSVVNISIAQRGVNRFTGQYASEIVGNASGVIIRSDGYILTNYHVIQSADEIYVRCSTDDVPAKVVGTDPSTDLAVLKVDRTDLQAAETGDSGALKVGETVVAVGSPFGLDKTVTSGIVSALNRSNLTEIGDVATYTNLIQTDAAINPGNSGGALANMRGQVVGINSLIESPSGSVGAAQSAGIGFAIPIKFAMRVADQLIATGKAEHPYMGVSMATVDAPVAGQLGLGDTRGAYVDTVVSGSPAQKAGLRAGDVITAIGGDPVRGVEEAFTAIRSRKVGDEVEVQIVRDGKAMTLKVTLGSDSAAR